MDILKALGTAYNTPAQGLWLRLKQTGPNHNTCDGNVVHQDGQSGVYNLYGIYTVLNFSKRPSFLSTWHKDQNLENIT